MKLTKGEGVREEGWMAEAWKREEGALVVI